MSKATVVILMSFLSIVARGANPPAPVTHVKVGNQEILADSNGRTAYVFDVDTDANSKCYSDCAKVWPPIVLTANDPVTAPFGVSIRTDGARQLTYQNHPIYLYAGDAKSGDIKGNGLGGVWHIIPL